MDPRSTDPLTVPSEEQAARMWSGPLTWNFTGAVEYDPDLQMLPEWFAQQAAYWRGRVEGRRLGRRSGLRVGFLLGIALGAAVLLAWTWFR